MIIYFEKTYNKPKKKYKDYKALTKRLESFDTFVITTTTSSSITLSLTGIVSINIRISSARTCWLTVGNKVIYEIVMQKFIK